MWTMIGACILQSACAMPTGVTYSTQSECVGAVIARRIEHPGNIYGCVPVDLAQDQMMQAARELYQVGAGHTMRMQHGRKYLIQRTGGQWLPFGWVSGIP